MATSDVICVSCGRRLGMDREDERDAEGPGRHLCGECNRARNFDLYRDDSEELLELDVLTDGELDGDIW